MMGTGESEPSSFCQIRVSTTKVSGWFSVGFFYLKIQNYTYLFKYEKYASSCHQKSIAFDFCQYIVFG